MSFLKKYLQKNKYETILYICILLYIVIFTHRTYLKHFSFSSFAWDLGVFRQLIHSSVFDMKPFYYTPELYLNPTGNYLAIHFSPILITVFPIYAIYPSIGTLLLLKALILGAAAYPLYHISMHLTGNDRTSLVIAVAYLLHPGLHGANWFDFQPQAFIPILMFTMFLMLLNGRWYLYSLSLALTLMIQEHVFAIVIAMLVGYLSYMDLENITFSIRGRRLDGLTIPLLSIPLCVVYYVVSKRLMGLLPITPEFFSVYKASGVFLRLNYQGETVNLPFYALTHLGRVFSALRYDALLKFLYILFLMVPLLFLPLVTRFVFSNMVLLLPFLLSNYRAYYMVGSHYALYILPGLFISTIYALRSKGDNARTRRCLLLSSVVMITFLSPLSPLSTTLNRDRSILWYPGPVTITDRTRWTHGVIDSIPRDASILTQNHIFPHVSQRTNAYVLPIDSFSDVQNELLESYVCSLIARSDYILFDLKSVDPWTLFAHRKLSRSGEFGVKAFNDMMILFRRGEKTNTSIGLERRTIYTPSDMHISFGELVEDPTSVYGTAALSREGSGKGHFLYGPYTYLLDPAYRVTFNVKASKPGEGYLGTLEVTSNRGDHLIAERDLYGYEVPDDGWKTFSLEVAVKRPVDLVEFRFYTVGACDLSVDSIKVERVEEITGYHYSTRSFNYKDLIAPHDNLKEGGILSINASSTREALWYGPYHPLPQGWYNATFHLKVIPEGGEGRILTLDAAIEEGMYTLCSRRVGIKDLDPHGLKDGWSRFHLNFYVPDQGTSVELRGMNPSPGYEISLGHILLEPLRKRDG
ncbi:MAG: DUF2079 domain-containing protein [Candidatus Bathyarchaeota archaeon]|jgi:uncharacterized membrane protein